jgi:hypothetical protein
MRWGFRLLVLAAFAYEGVALWTAAPGDTISEIVWEASRRPLVPFLAGLLCGHFFWSRG